MKEKQRKSKKSILHPNLKRFLIIYIFLFLVLTIYVSYIVYNKKNIEYYEKSRMIEDLKDKILYEEDKNKQLKKQNTEYLTNEDVEEIARKELGLIRRDEIVIKPNE